MSEVRALGEHHHRKRPSQLERAQRINRMQSRTYMNQIEVLENNIRKKLKVIENDKYQVERYLRFLKTSSGASQFSQPCPRSRSLRIRPATACSPVMKFGRSGNANHSYMVSDPAFGWTDTQKDDDSDPVRVRSACMSRSRMTTFHRTMTRIRKIEQPLRKNVSWVDGGQGGDDGILPYSPRLQSYRSVSCLNKDESLGSKRSSGTQCELASEDTECQDVDSCSVDSKSYNPSGSGSRKSTASTPRLEPKKRDRRAITPINVTFPFAITPKGDNQPEETKGANLSRPFTSHDRNHENIFHARSGRSKR